MTSCDEIADLLAVHLNTLQTSIAFNATNPPLVPVTNRAVDVGTLQVQPWEEDEQTFDRGDNCLCVRTVNVIVQCPMDDRTRADCMAWLNEVKEGLRETYLTASDGSRWKWRRNQTLTLYDEQAMKEKAQFLSLFRAEFYYFG